MNITLTPEIERALVEEARRRGTTPEDLALDSLRDRFLVSYPEEAGESTEETLADFLAGHIGVLDSSEHVPGGARMSEDTGRQFTDILIERRARGRL